MNEQVWLKRDPNTEEWYTHFFDGDIYLYSKPINPNPYRHLKEMREKFAKILLEVS